MKKINLLLFFTIVVLCTGCSADFEINIDNINNIDEKIELLAVSLDDQKQFKEFNKFIPIDINADDASVFKKKVNDINYYSMLKNAKKIDFRYAHHNIDTLNQDMFACSCYQYVTVMKQNEVKNNKENLLLSTSHEFLCFDKYDSLDEVNITINSKYKLKETNADKVLKHKYTWNINKENAHDKYIYLLLDLTERDLTIWEKIQEGEFINIFTVSLVLFLIGGLIYLFVRFKSNRNNKI